LDLAEKTSGGAPVLAVSARTGYGLEILVTRIEPRHTYAFVGPSGVGKSTLINRLLGRETQATQEVRVHDAKGMHTTTRRELLVMPGGGLLIDTPGMREFQLWGGLDSLAEVFPDIGGLVADCRFRDCTHTVEAGCAVLAAVESDRLDPERLESYQKLRRELEYREEQWHRPTDWEKRQPVSFASHKTKRHK
jgi:ribosome biogenesis GTPase